MVTVAGLTSGNTICVIIRKTPHPSIAAASSSSRGTFFKNPVNVRIPNVFDFISNSRLLACYTHNESMRAYMLEVPVSKS